MMMMMMENLSKKKFESRFLRVEHTLKSSNTVIDERVRVEVNQNKVLVFLVFHEHCAEISNKNHEVHR